MIPSEAVLFEQKSHDFSQSQISLWQECKCGCDCVFSGLFWCLTTHLSWWWLCVCRNFRQSRLKGPSASLDEWQKRNLPAYRRFVNVPDIFHRSPVLWFIYVWFYCYIFVVSYLCSLSLLWRWGSLVRCSLKSDLLLCVCLWFTVCGVCVCTGVGLNILYIYWCVCVNLHDLCSRLSLVLYNQRLFTLSFTANIVCFNI